MAELTKQAGTWVIGDPLDPVTQNGPLISAEHMAKVSGLVESGKAQGARLMCGGERGEGLMFKLRFSPMSPAKWKSFKKRYSAPSLL